MELGSEYALVMQAGILHICSKEPLVHWQSHSWANLAYRPTSPLILPTSRHEAIPALQHHTTYSAALVWLGWRLGASQHWFRCCLRTEPVTTLTRLKVAFSTRDGKQQSFGFLLAIRQKESVNKQLDRKIFLLILGPT